MVLFSREEYTQMSATAAGILSLEIMTHALSVFCRHGIWKDSCAGSFLSVSFRIGCSLLEYVYPQILAI